LVSSYGNEGLLGFFLIYIFFVLRLERDGRGEEREMRRTYMKFETQVRRKMGVLCSAREEDRWRSCDVRAERIEFFLIL
jgi:hypothetical protein